MDATLHLLLLEDNETDALLTRIALESHAGRGVEVVTVERLADALAQIDLRHFDVMVSDLSLPDSDGIATVTSITNRAPMLPLVVMTGTQDDALARAALQAGAQDFLVKGEASGPVIARTLRYAIERKRFELELRAANDSLELRVAARTAELESANRILVASQTRYRAVTESANDAIVTADHRGLIVGWNRGAQRIFGHSADEVDQLPLTMLMPERLRERHCAALERVMGGGNMRLTGHTIELQGLRKGGEEFPVELSLARFEIGPNSFVTGIIRDLTQRHAAEAMLRLQGAALAAAAEGIVITDATGLVRWTNPAMTQMTGYAAHEFTGRRPGDLLRSGVHDEAFHADMWGTILRGEVWRGEVVNRRKDETLYTEEMTITPVRDDRGAMSNFVAIKHDITERKRSTLALAECERRMRALLSNLQGMVYRCRNDAPWSIEFVSEGARGLLGVDPSELTSGSVTLAALIHADDRAETVSQLRRCLQQKQRYDARFRVRHADGRWIWVRSLACGVFAADGTLVSIEGYAIDVTERQEALSRLAESDRFTRATLNALATQVAILDEAGTIIAANQAWTEGTAERADPLHWQIGANFLSACSNLAAASAPDAPAEAGVRHAEIAAAIEALTQGPGAAQAFEVPGTTQPRRWTYCRISRFPGDGPVRVVVSREDITPLRVTQAALLSSEARYRSTFESAAIGIAQIGADGRYVQCNRALGQILGFEPEELVGLTFRELTYPADLPLGESLADRLLRGQIDHFAIEKRYRHRNGAPVWVNVIASAVTGVDGALQHAVAVVENIHLRKLTQLALQALNTPVNGEDFLRKSTQTLAELLDVEFAFVGETIGRERNRIRARAAWTDGAFAPNFDYALAGTPCDRVQGKDLCVYADDVQAQFPHDDLLVTMGVQSYAAVPLWSIARQPLGILAIMSRRPLRELEPVQTLLRLMALRVGAELEWERESRRVQDLFDLAPSATFMVDSKGAIQLASRAGERLFGWPTGAIAGQRLDVLVPPEHRIQYEALFRRFMLGGLDQTTPAQRHEMMACRRDGSTFPAEVHLSALGDAYDRTAVLHVQDITLLRREADLQQQINQQLEVRVQQRTRELEQAHAALGAKELEVRSVVEHMNDCVVTTDEQGLVRSVNTQVQAIFGYSAQELIGHNVSMLVPEALRPAHLAGMQAVANGGKAPVAGIERQVQGLHKNGQRIPIDLAISSYRIGERHYFTGVMRDIRERVRIMSELDQARDAAEQASRAKSAFLATMSHEIRTPMNGVVGMIDVLQQSSLTPRQTEIAGTARESAYALLAIVDDILDFSKIEAGQLSVEREPIDVEAVVAGACDTLDYLAHQKGVQLTLFTDPRLPGQMLGDAARLRQVVLNLAGNAIKFSAGMARAGRIRVRVQVVSAASGALALELSVTDNGIGMDTEALSRLFAPFSQADASTTRRFGGTGLGLSISQRLVTMMGGDIEVASAPGQGSRFTVHLPVVEVAAASPATSAPDVSGLHCMLLGAPSSVAADLGTYLAHGGALVEEVYDLDAAQRQLMSCASDAPIVVIDGQANCVDALRAASHQRPGLRPAYVLIGRGRRRRARLDAGDLVGIDGDVMRRVEFIKAVAMAAGRVAAEVWTPQTPDRPVAPSMPSVDQARAQGRLILVAEDNDINRQVLVQQLALLGLAAEVAGDGAQALRAWRKGGHALLLTDLHMPEMDGYELARALRAEEGALPGRIPIIAFTANAIRGEAQRCLDAGMDDYLTKPVQIAVLKTTLERWIAGIPRKTPRALPEPADAPADAPAGTPVSTVVDTAVLRSYVGGNAALLQELMQEFRRSAALAAGQIRSAAKDRDGHALATAAHRLKSSSRQVGAITLGEVCARLEVQGNDGRIDATLLADFDTVIAAVDDFLLSA